NSTAQESCPVDETARAKWLSQQALASNDTSKTATPGKSCDSSEIAASSDTPPALPSNHLGLGKVREVSTIPRANMDGSNSEHTAASVSSTSGNWIYPSEEMFFNAMKRKAFDPKAADMRTIVPIHNAVNERAWAEIKKWEEGYGSEKCGGPKLASFSGDSQKLTPKARFFTLLGYHPPFDRHDWTVDRCGQKIEYVIDFYSGKSDPKQPERVSFYLDVRPKISVEGVKMRMGRFFS
ncbi:cytochrome c/c1 heme-lyase, partial [Pyronema omphalodes]